jgi:hypothetical protein
LAYEIVAGNVGAISRARAQPPIAKLPLSQRDTQLALAREYGFPGWEDLVQEENQRLGRELSGPYPRPVASSMTMTSKACGSRWLEYPALQR